MPQKFYCIIRKNLFDGVLGIKQEGILRNHLVLSDGRIRHSVIFSVTHGEWSEIKKRIETEIELHQFMLNSTDI